MLTQGLKELSSCMLCGAGSLGRPLCAGCFADLPRLDLCCFCCGLPLPVDALCGPCGRSPPSFDRVIAVFPYRYPIAPMIHDLKYRGQLPWLSLLAAELQARIVAQQIVPPDCLLPVPQHWQRRWVRGFNQALEIAREVGRLMHIPVDDRLLRRVRPTRAQTSLRAAERSANVRGAFKLRRPLHTGARVTIVDDVVTTGATVEELSRVLKRAGAEEVNVWALARAGGN